MSVTKPKQGEFVLLLESKSWCLMEGEGRMYNYSGLYKLRDSRERERLTH